MQLTFDERRNLFIVSCKFEERHIPRDAQFVWDKTLRRWVTDEPSIAAALLDFADDVVRKVLLPTKLDNALAASRATDSSITIPLPPGLSLFPFQKAGVEYTLQRKDVLIADEMGLGKSVQGVTFCNCLPVKRVLYITLASLKVNAVREWQKWTTHPDLTIGIAAGKVWPNTDVVVVNYDILMKHQKVIRSVTWDVMIADEAHFLANEKAQRTMAVFGGGKGKKKVTPIPAKRRVCMTGTPLTSRPANLWPICKAFDPTGVGKDWLTYTRRYCAGFDSPWGYDFSGASHLDELQRNLRSTFMIRRLKSQVLTDLPPKMKQVIELPADGLKKLLQKEKAAYGKCGDLVEGLFEDEDGEHLDLTEEQQETVAELALLRQEVALAKLPMCVDFIQQILDADQKLVVYCYHKSVAAALKEAFPFCAFITGAVPQEKRQAEVDRFQTDADCTVFIGQITAAGAGHTLTAASKVVFVELNWDFASNAQAEDRVHRIGQLADTVNIYYLVLEDSLDGQLLESYKTKENNSAKALDV